MTVSELSAEERFATIVAECLGVPGVTPPSGTGFGASGLKMHGRIFAMLSSTGQFVVKLPAQRVDALIDAGEGERFDPGHGRRMKEWVVIRPDAAEGWPSLAREAMAFVAASRKEFVEERT